MAQYIPSPRQWVRDQVDLYESSNGTQGTTLRDTGLPVDAVQLVSTTDPTRLVSPARTSW